VISCRASQHRYVAPAIALAIDAEQLAAGQLVKPSKAWGPPWRQQQQRGSARVGWCYLSVTCSIQQLAGRPRRQLDQRPRV